ncbi:MAG: hypothetical protein EXR69_00975 [Myxococcales bacterium]|nr:hypothetical protein [Myxococcales bacterium]
MRIRKLELQGFKSFADRAVFHFGAGISGVVGPNGCGKSNVVDGVKWCLGEQRAKTLRGDSMTDVIFGGSTGRGAVSFAEVSLTFTADDEPFPGIWERFPEIDVTRRLYRDGTSEYRINQEKVRLRDVNDLFMDSGAGNQLYSFIEQGRIGQIVQAHPEQRRSLIEEAAGISRYKARREETLDKLALTRTSLERVGDLTDELARQLRSAERAVVRAMKWRELSARLRQQEIRLGLTRCHGLIADRKALSLGVREATALMAQATVGVTRAEAEGVGQRAWLEAKEQELGELKDGISRAEADRRVEESGVQFQERDAAGARDRLEQLLRDVEGLQTERDAASLEAETAAARVKAAEVELPARRLRAEGVGAEAQAVGLAVSRSRGRLDEARAAASLALEGAVKAKGVREGIGLRLKDLVERARRHEERVAEAKALDVRVEDEITRIVAQLSDVHATVDGRKTTVEARHVDVRTAEAARDEVSLGVRGAEVKVREAENAASAVQATVRAAEDAVRRAGADVTTRESGVRAREQAWTAADRERAGLVARIDAMEDSIHRSTEAPDGLRQALAVPGVIGLLAPLLEAGEGREAVLARALDGGLETVLVPDAAAAVRVAAGANGAKARVLVVPPIGMSRSGLADIRGSEVAERALGALAPWVVEVATVGEAYLAREQGGAARAAGEPARAGYPRVVTRDGAVLREDGVLLLGVGVAGTAAFARKREVAALKESLAGREQAVKVATDAVAKARAEVGEAEAARALLVDGVKAEVARVAEAHGIVEAARVAHRARQAEMAPAEAAIRAANGVLEAGRVDLRKAEGAEHEVRARLDSRRASVAEARRSAGQLVAAGLAIVQSRTELQRDEATALLAIQSSEQRQQVAEEAVRACTRTLETEEPRLTVLQAQIATLRLSLAELQGTIAAQGALADAARTRSERATARIAQVGQERSRLETRLVEMAIETGEARVRMQAFGEQAGALRDRADAARIRVGEGKAAVKQADEAARTARDHRDAVRDTLTKLESGFAACKDALERLRGDVEARHEVSLVALLDRIDRDGQLLIDGWEPTPVEGIPSPDAVPTLRIGRGEVDGDAPGLASEVAEVKGLLARIGEVNLGAEGEYREIADRHVELVRQRADLEEAMRIIEDVIGQLNRTCRERFRETFDLVADHFNEIYPRLVGGGSGRLALTNEDDLLVTGVEMYVQPPGKKVQQLSLLSGGEKAMAAIALIFSLFRVKPSPFCLLDEVDAPLDDGNGARFNDMLREMATRSQFIVITHNKKTMECADVLYGVSMPEPGTSRLVTVRLE